MTRRREVAARPLPMCDRLWSTAEVAAYLGVPVKTLHKWRYIREGPPTFKVGRHPRYDPDAVRRWPVEQCCPPDRCA
jgi:Helix-turn-helix domain